MISRELEAPAVNLNQKLIASCLLGSNLGGLELSVSGEKSKLLISKHCPSYFVAILNGWHTLVKGIH